MTTMTKAQLKTRLRLIVTKLKAGQKVPPYAYAFSGEADARRVTAEFNAGAYDIEYWRRNWSDYGERPPRMQDMWVVYPTMGPESNEWGEVAP